MLDSSFGGERCFGKRSDLPKQMNDLLFAGGVDAMNIGDRPIVSPNCDPHSVILQRKKCLVFHNSGVERFRRTG